MDVDGVGDGAHHRARVDQQRPGQARLAVVQRRHLVEQVRAGPGAVQERRGLCRHEGHQACHRIQRRVAVRPAHEPHGVGLKRRQPGQVDAKGAGAEIDRRFARHEDEGTRQSLDVPELDPHDVGAAARHLSRSKGQILGQEHVRNPDAVVSVDFLRSRAGRDCEDERAQQARDCSSGVHEPAGSHDSSPGSSLHER